MNILFISHDASQTGAPKILLQLAKWIKKNTNHKIFFLIVENGERINDFAETADLLLLRKTKACKRTWCRALNKILFYRLRNKIEKLRLTLWVKKRKIDLVYNNTFVNGEILKILDHNNVITHVHEKLNTIRELGEENTANILKYTKHYIAVSKSVYKDLTELGINSSKISTIYGFINTGEINKMSHTAPSSAENFIISASGNTDWRKGADLFVYLAKKVNLQTNENIKFVWIGQNSKGVEDFYKKLRYDIGKMKINNIEYTGLVKNPYPLYKKSNIFVLTSREDPFPLVVLENAALGKPVVCFADAGGAPEFIEKNNCGIVVPYGDIDKMAEAVLKLIKNKKLYKVYSDNAIKNIQNYSLEKTVRLILALIEKDEREK